MTYLSFRFFVKYLKRNFILWKNGSFAAILGASCRDPAHPADLANRTEASAGSGRARQRGAE